MGVGISTDFSHPFAIRRFGAGIRRKRLVRQDKPGYSGRMETNTKPYKGLGMEGGIARWYAAHTKRAMPDYEALASRAAKMLPAGSSVLEAAPGPGYFAIALARAGDFHVSGLDISQTFVEIAQANARQAHVQVDFRRGNVSSMPFPEHSFDFLLCRAAFKNFTEPVGAIKEMHRVLKPGGKAWIIDLRRDAPPEAVNQAVDEMHLGMVNGIVTKLTFRFMLLKRAYIKPELQELIAQTPFKSGTFRDSPIGFEVELQK